MFKLTKIPAIAAKDLLDRGRLDVSLTPLRLWVTWNGLPLTDEVIAAHVIDWEALTQLELDCYEYNFGFLRTWQPVTIPPEAMATYKVAETKSVDPMIASLVANELATYKELRDEYSLEEAFKLLDVLAVKRVNEFRATEEARKK